MAVVAKSGTPEMSTVAPPFNADLGPFTAGEAIGAGDACTVHTDGKCYKATGVAADLNARVWGFAPEAVRNGNPISLYDNVTFEYGSGLTPSTRYFLSATAGALDTVATLGGTVPIAVAISATRVRVFASLFRQ